MDLQGSFPSSKGKEEKREKRTLTQQARDVGTGPPLPLEYQWDPHMRPWLGPFWPLPWYIRAGSGKQKHRTARSFVERASREHRESIVRVSSIDQLGPNDNGNDARYILADYTRNGIQQDHYLDNWKPMRTQNQRVQLELISI
ncbi:hypothetical protein HZH66_004199 [Vespula vulgaris]|uniref:Uncharacterized protein n=1 Tax=Vespula vulgaris TaxID=7454 RepID=A0A834KEM9_VESVU|nr:hypothetical protein HZH66_004199 [Vespula vulgaris]